MLASLAPIVGIFDCQGNFLSGASASNVAGAIVTVNTASAFPASSGSVIHNCEFDAAGNFARDLTIADWDWMVDKNLFKNAKTVNVALELWWAFSRKLPYELLHLQRRL